MRKQYWGECLDLRGRKYQEAGEDCIMKSFVNCIFHQILGWSSQGGWDGRGM